MEEKGAIFTQHIRDVWQLIHSAKEAQQDGAGKVQILIFTLTRIIEGGVCDHKRYLSSRVHLSRPLDFPQLESVRALSVCNPTDDDLKDNGYRSKLDLRVIIDLAGRCPNLEYLGCKLGAGEWVDTADPWMEHFMYDFPGCRRDARHDFAVAMSEAHLSSTLQHVQLDFIHELYQSVQEQRKAMPNLVLPYHLDPFSTSLRLLSCQLRQLDLHVIAHETLFWPVGGDAAPLWPNLESLSVLFRPCAPSGRWYFQSPLGRSRDDKGSVLHETNSYPPPEGNEDDSEWCFESMNGTPNGLPMFRVYPNENNLVPLMTGFAEATTNMPKFLEAWLWSPLSYHPYGIPEAEDVRVAAQYPNGEFGWGVVYSAPGAPPIEGTNCTAMRQLKCRVGPWRPTQDLRNLFMNIRRAQYGPEVNETWHDDEFAVTLISREWFCGGTICPDMADPNRYPTFFERASVQMQ